MAAQWCGGGGDRGKDELVGKVEGGGGGKSVWLVSLLRKRTAVLWGLKRGQQRA